MVNHVEYGSSVSKRWREQTQLTEEQKRKLIEDKINKAKQYLSAKGKTKSINPKV
jgi:hypothetical protein